VFAEFFCFSNFRRFSEEVFATIDCDP